MNHIFHNINYETNAASGKKEQNEYTHMKVFESKR